MQLRDSLTLLGLICVLGILPGCTASRGPTDADARSIRAVLDDQVAAWNRGDIEGFMQGYWQSDSLRFASGGTVRFGWQATLDRYRQSYPDSDAMGQLTFDGLSIRLIDGEHAYVFGHWALARDDRFEPASGLFTLLLRRFPQGWRIVHDHTSSAR